MTDALLLTRLTLRHYHSQKNEDALKRYIEQTYRCYGVIEGQLAKSGGESILPGKITAADVHFYPWILQYEYAGLSLDSYPNLAKWFKNMKEMKEVKAAYQKIEQAPKP